MRVRAQGAKTGSRVKEAAHPTAPAATVAAAAQPDAAAPAVAGRRFSETSPRALASGSGANRAQRSVQDVVNRTIFSILMAYAFLALISLGVYAGVPLVVVIVITMYHEVTRIQAQAQRKRHEPLSVVFVQWYFLVLAVVYMLAHNFRKQLAALSLRLEALTRMLPFIGFCGVLFGMMTFVLTLRKGMYRYQFTHFTWTIMAVLVIGSQGAAEMANMMHGMIWFLLPVSCVINNDVWAYVCGKFFGRTRLLALSPKKTLEGFCGAFVLTVWWAFWFCGFLSYFPAMYCAVDDGSASAAGATATATAQCSRSALFVQRDVAMPRLLAVLSGGRLASVRVSPAQQHALVLGTFASLVAPFGGFFASGLKRAFRIKDFGDLIPGHGGMTDRMDCQGVMGLFTYFYLHGWVLAESRCASLETLTRCALRMPPEERQLLQHYLTASLRAA